jgi:hypothetical protein
LEEEQNVKVEKPHEFAFFPSGAKRSAGKIAEFMRVYYLDILLVLSILASPFLSFALLSTIVKAQRGCQNQPSSKMRAE